VAQDLAEHLRSRAGAPRPGTDARRRFEEGFNWAAADVQRFLAKRL